VWPFHFQSTSSLACLIERDAELFTAVQRSPWPERTPLGRSGKRDGPLLAKMGSYHFSILNDAGKIGGPRIKEIFHESGLFFSMTPSWVWGVTCRLESQSRIQGSCEGPKACPMERRLTLMNVKKAWLTRDGGISIAGDAC
jgi:hypothetical protein